MSGRNLKALKALLLWTRDRKTGIESLTCVPEHSRFVGAVTPVMFSGDKKYYPAKVLLISDDMAAIEKKACEMEEELATELKAKPVTKRSRKQVPTGTAASERDVAVALGGKPPVPSTLQGAHKAHQKAKNTQKTHHILGQNSLDSQTAHVVKNLFSSSASTSSGKAQGKSLPDTTSDDENESVSESDGDNIVNSDEGEDNENCKETSDGSGGKWCECKSCHVLHKYDTPLYRNLQDLAQLFHDSVKSTSGKLHLQLKEIAPSVKQVELVSGRGIYIPLSDKEQLKVDHKNKPSSLARETLFALYGREVFKVLTVTGCGQKKGSYAIPTDVLKAVCTFVNRNVSAEKALKLTKLTSLINKRAPEWRKSPSPKQKAAAKTKGKSIEKVVSTSPFKTSPLSPVKEPSQDKPSPVKSPAKPSPVKSPAKPSPVKSPAKPSPVKSAAKPSPEKSTSSVSHAPSVPVTPVDQGSYPYAGPYYGPPHQPPTYDWNFNYNHHCKKKLRKFPSLSNFGCP